MKRLLLPLVLALFLLSPLVPLWAQLQEPSPPVNIIIDSDMSENVDDVGDHAVLWALQNRGEANILAIVASSAYDYSAPAMRVIANYYGHPNVPIGAHKGSTPTSEGSNTSVYAQQIANQFGTPGDTRFNYPDAVTVYRQALANAPDHSVYIVSNGYFQPLQGLLRSQPDGISSLTGLQLIAQKVKRLVCSAGTFPSGSEHNFRVDPDAASYVFANWPAEIVSVGSEVGGDVPTGPSPTSDPNLDPVRAAYGYFDAYYGRTDLTMYAWGQVALLYAVRGGIGTNFSIGGYNGQTTVWDSTQSQPGYDVWSQSPSVGHSYLEKSVSAYTMYTILNPMVQGSSSIPILRSISPSTIAAGSPAQTVTLTGNNFFNDSQVFFNGNSRPSTLISGTQVGVQLSSTDLAQTGTATLSVLNDAEGGWRSNSVNLNIVNPMPSLAAISPASVNAGSAGFTLNLTGSNFVPGSSVQVNGTSRSTTFISATQLGAAIPASDLTVGTYFSVTVFNPAPGGGTSAALTLTVNNPAPSISSVSPNPVLAMTGS